MNNQPAWRRFWFETYQVFGIVNTPEDWARIKADYNQAYPGSDVYELKEIGNRDKYPIPNFGESLEHTGDRTLGEFLRENGMDASLNDRGKPWIARMIRDTLHKLAFTSWSIRALS